MLKKFLGAFWMLMLSSTESLRLFALKNFGFVTPPPPPRPSHQRAPCPSRTWPGAPLIVMLFPEIEKSDPSHSA